MNAIDLFRIDTPEKEPSAPDILNPGDIEKVFRAMWEASPPIAWFGIHPRVAKDDKQQEEIIRKVWGADHD